MVRSDGVLKLSGTGARFSGSTHRNRVGIVGRRNAQRNGCRDGESIR